MYPNFPQNNYNYPQAYGQPQITLQGYPVPDERTAREAQVNTNGTISVFPDIQNGKIYTKQLDMNTFNPIFKTYQLVQEQSSSTNYVSMEDYQKLYQYVVELERKIEEIPLKMADNKGVIDNAQSYTNDGKQSNYANDGNVAKQQ